MVPGLTHQEVNFIPLEIGVNSLQNANAIRAATAILGSIFAASPSYGLDDPRLSDSLH